MKFIENLNFELTWKKWWWLSDGVSKKQARQEPQRRGKRVHSCVSESERVNKEI